MKTSGSIALLAALALAGAASAATPAWTPAKVAATVQLMVPLSNSNGTWLAHGFIKNAACRADGRAFVCSTTIQAGILSKERVSLWVKPWSAARLCVSRVGPSVCAAPLMRNDPRVCGRAIADGCLIQRAATAVEAKQGGGLSATCVPAGPLAFTCTGDSVHTVTFAKGVSQWTVSVTP